VAQQLGFGFGKGRRVIKTTIAGDDLTYALEKQDRFYRHQQAQFTALYDEWKRALARDLQTLRTENAMLRRRRLLMAKATLRSDAR
jgi:hypothetical protein